MTHLLAVEDSLGSYMARGKVQLRFHGGTVQAASAGSGPGTGFIVRQPGVREPQALAAAAPAPSGAQQRLKVLVVEDNRDAADSLKMLLGLMGHDVKVAYTGPEGVETAKNWAPDTVVCDIGLPGLDGYGVARELRLHPSTAQVRLIALTGYGTENDRRLASQAGFDHHLTKPAEPQALLDLLTMAG